MASALLWFADILRITGSEVISSHVNTLALDYAGYQGSGLQLVATVPLKLIKKDSAAFSYFLTTVDKVRFSDGTIDYASFSCGHMDNLSMYNKYSVGQIIKAGEVFYQQGSRSGGKNGAVGNHIHMRIHQGTLKDPYWYKSSTGNYDLVSTGGKRHHYDVLFLADGTKRIFDNENANKYNFQTWTGGDEMSYETWNPIGAKLEIKATQVNRRETPNGTKLSGGFAPAGIYPIVEATKEAVGGYKWIRCEGFDGWVALMDNATVWINPITEEPIPIDPGSDNKVIEELKKQLSLLEAEMKYKDDRIAYLEKAAYNLEKELDATILSANEKQKKITEAIKILGG
jgi:Uncharacterized conserved protein